MWDWKRRLGATPREVVAPAPKAPAPEPVKADPVIGAPVEPTSFFGCADIHTPHFGVTHTPLSPEEKDEDA